jgi:hypothetical protein
LPEGAGVLVLVFDWKIAAPTDEFPFNPVASVMMPNGTIRENIPEVCLEKFSASSSGAR